MTDYLKPDEKSLSHNKYRHLIAVQALTAQRDLLKERLIEARKEIERLKTEMAGKPQSFFEEGK